MGQQRKEEGPALADVDTVWLNRQQLATLFGRDIKTIGKHVANALKEELRGFPVVSLRLKRSSAMRRRD